MYVYSSVVRHGGQGASVRERHGEREPRGRDLRGEFLRGHLGDGESESGTAAGRKNSTDFRHLSGLHATRLPDSRLRRRLPLEVSVISFYTRRTSRIIIHTRV